MSNDTGSDRQPVALLKRIAPPLAFAAALCLLVVCCYDSGHTGLPPTEKRYAAAKTGITNLKRDDRKSSLREPWEKLALEFQSIYDSDPAWPNRPAALFRAAESLEELTSRSYSRTDARKAVNCYEALALRHASSRLADDALFRAASMRATWLRDEKGALALLERLKRQYPNGDMIERALALEKALKAAAHGKTAPSALRAATEPRPAPVEDLPVGFVDRNRSDFAGDLPLRYRAAKSRISALRADKIKSCWRQSWEELKEEFLRIHKSGKNRLSPPALFQAAVCQQTLAQCSRLASDHRKAVDMYLEVSAKYPDHALADDALLNAARIQRDLPSGQKKAIETLNRLIAKYPRGDMVQDAKKLLSLMEEAPQPKATAQAPSQPVKTREQPELQVLSWDSPNKNSVQIILEMSAPTAFTTRLVEGAKGQPDKLFVDLENASIVNDVRKGVTVHGSLLQAVRARHGKSSSTLQFDFRDVKGFNARAEDDPCRIILSVAAGNTPLPGQPSPKNVAVNKTPTKKQPAGVPAVTQVANMASQLGLTVHRVFIDAGHGGKDPGTNHNKIMERIITLDIAQTLGRLLAANGLEVVYSRTKDKAVALSERTRMANAARADLFVSIHVNAHDNIQTNGFETYFLNLASTPQAARLAMLENARSDKRLGDMQKMVADVMLNARADESRRLATDIQRVAIFRLKKREFTTRNNGVKSAPFHVLCGAKMPAALVEVGYCTNPEEARKLALPQYRHAIAEGMAEGILAYRDRLLRNRTADNALTGNKADAM